MKFEANLDQDVGVLPFCCSEVEVDDADVLVAAAGVADVRVGRIREPLWKEAEK